VIWGLVPDGFAIGKGIRKRLSTAAERYLSEADGAVAKRADKEGDLRLRFCSALPLHGARKNELLGLRWRTWTLRAAASLC